jgi:hypothetical protein
MHSLDIPIAKTFSTAPVNLPLDTIEQLKPNLRP